MGTAARAGEGHGPRGQRPEPFDDRGRRVEPFRCQIAEQLSRMQRQSGWVGGSMQTGLLPIRKPSIATSYKKRCTLVYVRAVDGLLGARLHLRRRLAASPGASHGGRLTQTRSKASGRRVPSSLAAMISCARSCNHPRTIPQVLGRSEHRSRSPVGRLVRIPPAVCVPAASQPAQASGSADVPPGERHGLCARRRRRIHTRRAELLIEADHHAGMRPFRRAPRTGRVECDAGGSTGGDCRADVLAGVGSNASFDTTRVCVARS